MCIILLFKPIVYAKTCLNALSVWTFNILPVLFPFFILTRMIVNLDSFSNNKLDKFFNKIYHSPSGSLNTLFLSTLSGYPMGAKLICSMHENQKITNNDAKKMMSFCSVSGPMFMLGTVGLSMLHSFKAGLIILISNIVASLLNGLIYRGGQSKDQKVPIINKKQEKNILSDCVYDSLISILMVGSYVVLSFLIIEVLCQTHIIELLSRFISCVFNIQHSQDVVESILKGSIEITSGILSISTTKTPLFLKTIISSGLVGFGGFSIMMQSMNFLSKLKIPFTYMIKQKLSQSIICVLISIPLCLIFF